MITARHFSESEFKRLTPSCSLQDMKQECIDMWDKVRDITGIPLIVNCGYRSVAWDLKKGRSGNSAHTRGYAMDIRCNADATRMKIVKALIQVGCKRIGIYKTFIHADCDPKLTQNVIWYGL